MKRVNKNIEKGAINNLDDYHTLNRRKFITISALSLSVVPAFGFSDFKNMADAKPVWLIRLLKNNDDDVSDMGKNLMTDKILATFGALNNDLNIPNVQGTGHYITRAIIAFISSESQFFKSEDLRIKIKNAIQYMLNAQHSDGTIDLLDTNFHSTPDTGFSVENLSVSYKILKGANIKGGEDMLEPLKKYLLKCGEALIVGGIHTPNHRWVVSAALTQLNLLFPDIRYVRRIEQWLAEHIDLDPDGQYTEKSTGIYSTVIDKALITIANGLDKPELLDYVRKNLQMTMFFVHPNGEVVTDASNRQDKGGISTFENYYYSYRYLAILDKNPEFAAMCQLIEKSYFNKINGDLIHFLEDKFLWNELPTATSFSTNYAKFFPYSNLVRIRRDLWDATLLINNPNFLTFHKNNAILQGMRINASFFGKGQFQSPTIKQEQNQWIMYNKLEGVYYQPFSQDKIATDGNWEKMPRSTRTKSEIQHLETIIKIKEISGGIEIEFDMKGTDGVPVSLELIFRTGGKLTGVQQSEKEPNSYLFGQNSGTYTVGNDVIQFGPGKSKHKGIHLRGGLPADTNSTSVYLTDFTPFKHTITLK